MAKSQSPKSRQAGYVRLGQEDPDSKPSKSGAEAGPDSARGFSGCPGSAIAWPEANASWFSRLWFLWVTPMIQLGNRTHLEADDFWAIDDHDCCEANFRRFDVLWRLEEAAARRTSRSVDILRPIVVFAAPMIVRTACLQLISVACKFIRPLLLQQILLLVEGQGGVVARDRGWVLALALFLTTVIDFLCSQHQGWQQYKQQVRVRAAVLGLLYRQLTQLSCGTKSAYSSGKITNMMDTDQSVLQTFTTQLNAMWLVPLTFALALFMVLQLLGWSGLVAVVCMIALAPVSRKAIEILRKWKKQRNIAADARLKNLTEVMQGIRIIKFMNWETSFSCRIDALRNDEVKAARMAAVTRSIYVAYAEFQPLVILIVSLATYSLVFDQTLTASLAFPLLNYLMLLRDPLKQFPDVLNWVFVEGRIAAQRISQFLSEGEAPRYVERGARSTSDGRAVDELAVEISGGAFRWEAAPKKILWDPADKSAKFGSYAHLKKIQRQAVEVASLRQASDALAKQSPPVLQQINLKIKTGTLCCIVGQVGAGKTALLNSMLGEMDCCSGTVRTRGALSYSAQSPFILNATIKANIVFSSEYDEQRYLTVIRGCALVVDLQTLPDGDNTEIGERGINLSGGQRQRLALARALYRHADIYLLDDPLSAVDTHTGRHIMDFLIEFTRSATVIMPCHQLHFLHHANLIVTLRDSTIGEQGTFEELMHAEGEFAKLMESHAKSSNGVRDEEVSNAEPSENQISPAKALNISDEDTLVALKGTGKAGSLIVLEERNIGKVGMRVYKFYARQYTFFQLAPLAIFYVLAQLSQFAMDMWMSRWAVGDRSIVPDSLETNPTLWYCSGYAVFGIGTFVFAGLRYLWVQLIGLRASSKLHNLMLGNLLHAPTSFFDVTPVGRIMNRFSGDISNLDISTPVTYNQVITVALQLLNSFVVVTIYLPAFFAWVAPMAFVYHRIISQYRSTAREIKRLNSNSRSPVFQHFNETVNGLVTVRAFDAVSIFIMRMSEKVDCWTQTEMAMRCCPQWLGMRISALAACSILLTTLAITLQPDRLDAGLVGLILTYANMVNSSLQGFLTRLTDVEIRMNGVERIRYFAETVVREAPYAVADSNGRQLIVASSAWPNAGYIRFKNVSAKYRPELSRVLEGLTMEVTGGWKVGVCGRTGSGKSTLMLLLFRLLELDSGSITIDDVDIATLGLSQLRCAIAMLPQDPTLFSGTIRQNLDPFDKHSDAELTAALEKAQLQQAFSRQGQSLDSQVGEGGGSLSVGQRQLLCFARALLRGNKILVMDECTANVDVQTDALLQKMVRKVFRGCTIFTIAHRLATVIDYDRIAVLDSGRLVEFGAPRDLLDAEGHLTRLVQQTGPAMAAHLRSVAYAAHPEPR